MTRKFKFQVKVYYEDTDAGGIVYYANYLKYLERARSEAINSIGLSNKKILDKFNIRIIVKSCKIEYKKSASLEDNLEIISYIKNISKASFTMIQKIVKNVDEISLAEIKLVTVNHEGKLVKIPNILKTSLEN